MSGLLTYKNGRLKTGRVAILVFVALLVMFAMAFKINKSVDRALVAVKHVFEPEEIQPSRQTPPVSQDVARVEPEKSETVRQKEAIVLEEARGEEKKEVEPTFDRKAEKETKKQEIAESSPVEDVVQAKDEQKEKIAEAKTARDLAGAAESVSPDAQRQEHDEGTQNKVSEEQRIKPVVVTKRPEETTGDEKAVQSRLETIRHTIANQDSLAKIAGKSEEGTSKQLESSPKGLDISEKLNRVTALSEQPKKKDLPQISKAMQELQKPESFDADRSKREITVDQKQYMALFHGWCNSGNGAEGKEKIPLRVENLRNAFELFQMKPIAVIRGHSFLDLTDGTRVAERSLDEYSTTVFLVDRPWDKWNDALAVAGVRRGDTVEVRYYMYDFVKNAIYARVNQAFSWCKDQGLIKTDSPAAGVDVLGRAYVIKRQGGGRFGVFVPVSLDIKDGHTVAIDPVCFRGQSDVEALRDAGLL